MITILQPGTYHLYVWTSSKGAYSLLVLHLNFYRLCVTRAEFSCGSTQISSVGSSELCDTPICGVFVTVNSSTTLYTPLASKLIILFFFANEFTIHATLVESCVVIVFISVCRAHVDQKNNLGDNKNSQDSNNTEKKKPHIKKPLNAFMLYMKEMRAKVVAECTLKESAAINQILGRRVRHCFSL